MRIQELDGLRSCDWALDIQLTLEQFTVVLEWNAEPGIQQPEFGWITLTFGLPASSANIDYSQMWQHAPDDNESPLVNIREHHDNSTHHSDITLNLESHPTGWWYTEICAQSDAIQVIGRQPPFATLYGVRPAWLERWHASMRAGK